MISTGRGCGGVDGTRSGIGRGAPLSSPAAVYWTHSMPPCRTPVDAVRQPAMVGGLQAGHALGDHGLDPRIRAGGGEACSPPMDSPSTAILPIWTAGWGQERHRRGDVPVAPPAEIHRRPARPPMATGVGQQRPVALPGQHRRLRQHRGSGGPRRAAALPRHRCAVRCTRPTTPPRHWCGKRHPGRAAGSWRGWLAERAGWAVGRIHGHRQREQHKPQQRDRGRNPSSRHHPARP